LCYEGLATPTLQRAHGCKRDYRWVADSTHLNPGNLILAFPRIASRDHFPGPLISRKATVRICAYSERTSCKTAHTPTCGGAGGGGKGDVPRYKEIFDDNIATTISMMNGMAINRFIKQESN